MEQQPRVARPARPLVAPALAKAEIEEIKEHIPRDPRVYYITDLVQCPLKREFSVEMPEVAFANATNPRILLGVAVHIGVEELLKKVYGDKVLTEFRDNTEAVKIVKTTGGFVVVRGRIDAIILAEGRKIGVEIKFTTSKPQNLPHESHVEQAELYNWLFDLDETRLVYITPDGFQEFVVAGKPDDKEVERRIASKNFPRHDWECRYCPFRALCPYTK